ncbi:MAG: DUF349 domain-containing protein [Victivallaceae bacterium]|nr:DUF349 domain-containing protein [Victivallaceae bacterium]NLK84103.1 DUF349 domain-containing protein [Lentisphaerota bacterium]
MLNNLLLRMKLSSSDPETRLAALEKIPLSDQEVLLDLALTDASMNIRHLAALKLNNEAFIEQACAAEQDPKFKKLLRNKLNRVYIGKLLEGKNISTENLRTVDDEDLLVTAACSAPTLELRSQAAGFIKTDAGIKKLLQNTEDIELGTELLRRFDNNEEILRDLSKSANSEQLRKAAEKKIEKPKLLAEEKEEPEQHPGIGSELKNKLHAYEYIINEIRRLSGNISTNAKERLNGLKQKWQELPDISPSYLEVLEIEFNQACDDFNAGIAVAEQRRHDRIRKIGILDEIYAKALRMQADSTVKRENLNQLIQEWDETAEGLEAIEHLQERWVRIRAELEEVISAHQERLNDSIDYLEKINSELELQAKKQEPEITRERRIELEKEVSDLIENFPENRRLNAAKERFTALNMEIRRKLHDIYEIRDLERWENYALKVVICEQLEKLLENNDLHQVAREFKEQSKKWRNTGFPPHEKNTEINARYHAVADEINRRCNIFFTELNQQRSIIAAAKEGICEAAEALQHSTSWKKTADKLKEMQQQWRAIGFTWAEKEKKLRERFMSACNIFFDARKEFYNEKQLVYDKAAELKKALCEETERLSSANPGELLRNSKDFWDRWREAGFSGNADKELYERFKSCFDTVYEGRRKVYEEKINLKKDICTALRELVQTINSDHDLQSMLKQFHELQKQWDDSGSIGNEHKHIDSEYHELVRQMESELHNLRRNHQKMLIDAMEKRSLAIAKALNEKDIEAAKNIMTEQGSAPAELQWMDTELLKIIEAMENHDSERLSAFIQKQSETLQQMENICSELERIAGINVHDKSDDSEPDKMLLDLAAALQGGVGGFNAKKSTKQQDKNELRKQWLNAGIPPYENVTDIFARFRTAIRNDK